MSENVEVTAAPGSIGNGRKLRLGDEAEHAGESEERPRGDHVGDGGAARVRRRRDEPAGNSAQADAEVAADALKRVRGVAPRGGRETREQRRLARPETAVPHARD